MSARKNRITLISPSFSVGGAEQKAINLANYYASIGQDVTMIVLSSKGPFKKQLSPLVKLVTLNAKGCYAFFKLYKVLKKDNADVIFSVVRETNLIVGWLAYFLTLPLVFCESDFIGSTQKTSPLKTSFNKLVMKLSYKKAKLIITNSTNVKEALIENKIVLKGGLVIINDPILVPENSDLMHESISHSWFDGNKFDLVFSVGKLEDKSNQELILYAFSELYKANKRARLIISGDGCLESRLNRLAKLLSIEAVIEIIPFQKSPLPFYKAASVFALAFSCQYASSTLVEAMWCRTPVVALDCPDVLKPNVLLSRDDPNVFSTDLNLAMNRKSTNDIEKAYTKSLEYKVSDMADLYFQAFSKCSIGETFVRKY